MINIMAGSLSGILPPFASGRLEIVSVLTNNACNLRCKHCYLQTSPQAKFLTDSEWLAFFGSLFADVAPSVLCFAGKEPFLNRKSLSLVQDTVRLRDKIQGIRRTQVGVITNGTLLRAHRDALTETAPDYFDISIDGLPHQHDSIRGQGAFAMLEPNLAWAINAFGPERIWITHTLTALNVGDFAECVSFYNREFGVERFSIGMYTPLSYTSPELTLGEPHYSEFVRRQLKAVGEEPFLGNGEVVLDLDQKHPYLVDLLEGEGLVVSDVPFSSVVSRLRNGVAIRSRCVKRPVGLWRSVRVTPEGYWLAAEDLMRVRDYQSVAATTLRDCGFSADEAYRRGLASPRYAQLCEGAAKERAA